MSAEGIILAAGLSSRMGSNKLLLRLKGRTILESCIESLYGACSNIYVVGGYRVEDIYPIVAKYKKARVVFNEEFEQGMFSSVKAGIKQIKSERFFLTPGDLPMVKKSTAQKLLKTDCDIALPIYQGVTGHPVLIKSALIPEILHGGYFTLSEFINEKTPQHVEVNDVGIITDVDTPDEYKRVKMSLIRVRK